jgi:ectoine hydroxylase-related dioxygenase (phytanoyl-CoA dioxygenase family)
MPSAAIGFRRSISRKIRQVPGINALVEYARRHTPLLSEEQVNQFQGSGYLVFDPLIPDAVLTRAVADLADHPDMVNALHHGSRVFDGWKLSRAVRAIALSSHVLRALRQLYGREPLPFQTLNFPIGTEQKVHSDVIHFASDPPTFMCGVWVALEDIDMDNGALVYYPGSHMLPVVTMEDIAPGPGKQYYDRYEARIERLVREHNLEPEYAILKRGQALIWASNLLHGGSSHRDKRRTRHSQVTHYFFEGCQYYTPLGSYGGYRNLRKLERVR